MRGKLLVAAVLLLPVAPAYGADLKIAETVTSGGDPGLTAAMWPADGSTIEWRRCADGATACDPLPDSEYVRMIPNGRVAFPGETSAGTVFEAVATKDGVETKARTRAWHGRLASATPPALQGEAAVGKPVTVAPGTWSGGWGSSPAANTMIFACREPVGADCWVIAYGSSTAPEPRWAGWYLFVQEYFNRGDAVCNAILGCFVTASIVAPPFPYALQRSATIERSAPLGPIAATPVSAPPVKKPPTASVRVRALRRKGQLLVARVRCETQCSVQLKVSGGKRRAHYKTLRVTGAKALTVPVRHGKLKVRVVVDGKLVTSGPTLAR